MAAQGPNYPSTSANDTGVGTIGWFFLSNVLTDDGNGSTATMSGGAGTKSNYLKVTNFGFTVPSGATIDGILLEIKRRRASSGGNTADNIVKLVKGGTVSGTDHAATSTTYPTTLTYASYGGSSDLWGLSLTDTDVNDSTFGAVLSVNKQTGGKINVVTVDTMRITVYYTTGGGGGSQTNAIDFAGD